MAVIKKDGSSMGLPMNINRGNPIPIDTTSVWYSLAEAEAYAQNGATAYVGQTITVVNEVDKSATVYVIKNEDGDLIELTSTDSTTKNQGVLRFGKYTYDGSADVTVKLYDGEVITE